jgi:threonine synthase
MGLPIGRLRIATNVNDILARTLATGSYELRDVRATTSPSMDIQVSSNFERLVFEAAGRDAALVRGLMASLTQSGRFELPAAAIRTIRGDFDAGSADEEETAAAIRATWRESGELIDPHTAVAVAVEEKETANPPVPTVMLSTAHPAKFPDAVEAACGVRPELPNWLGDLMTRPERITVMPNVQADIEAFVLAASRAAREGVVA